MKHPRSIAAAALFLAACSDNPVAPKVETTSMAPSASRLSAINAPAASELDLTITDVRERLIPMLENATAAARIETLMAGAQAAVDGGDIAEAHRQLIEAQLLADPNGDGTAGDLGDPANVAVLRLTLENLASATGA
jgi:hypothetical protein